MAAGADGGLAVTGAADAAGRAATVVATVQGVTAKLPVTVGLVDVSLAEFEPGENWTATAARGTASVSVVAAPDRPGATADNHALRLTYDFTGQTGTSAAYAVAGDGPITLPVGTKKLALWVNGDGQNHWLRAMVSSQGTTNVPFTFATTVDWTGWRQVVGDLPAGFSDPVTLLRVYLAETLQTNKNAGQLDFDALAAQVGQQPDDADPPQPDPYVVEQGGLPDRRWTFAVLSDLHVSAAAGLDSFSGHQAVEALGQVVASKPDFILINGDFVDDNNPADFELADGLLKDHVPGDLPVYWTPGNHEAGLSATGGLDAFLSVTGRPNRQVIDHKGTRFILLDSHTGDMRTSDWDQVPLLQAELAKAAKDPSVRASWCPSTTRCRTRRGPARPSCPTSWRRTCSSAGSRTSASSPASRSRCSPATRTPPPSAAPTGCSKSPRPPWARPRTAPPTRAGSSAGCTSRSTRGRPGSRAGQPSPQTRDWLQAESRPLIDGIELAAPAQLAVGARATVAATGVTSEFGLRFPLRFPASVTWSGGARARRRGLGRRREGGRAARRPWRCSTCRRPR